MNPFISKDKKIKLYEELCRTLASYSALLAEELKETQGLAWSYGWRSTEEKIKAGIDLRKKISELTTKLGWK